MTTLLEARMTLLEELMADTLRVVRETSLEVSRVSRETSQELDRLSREMREFKDEMREFKRESNRRWGDLAASLGTLAEDIVAPSIPRVLREVVGCDDIEFFGVRVQRKHPTKTGVNREFDTVAMGCGYFLVVETKIKPTSDAVAIFADSLPEVKEYFPEFAPRNLRFIGALAGLYVDPRVVAFAERRGLIVLGTGEELMSVLNSEGFIPQPF